MTHNQETLPPSYQIWERLQKAATDGSLGELQTGLAQLQDPTILTNPHDISTWFVPNMVERFFLSQPTAPSPEHHHSSQNHHLLLPLLHRLLTLTSRHGHLPLTAHLLDTYSPSGLPVTAPVVRGALSHKHWDTMQLFLDRGLWDINQPVEGGNTLPVLKQVLPSEEHVKWLLARGADPCARSKGGNLDIPTAAAKMLVPVGVWRLLNDAVEGGGALIKSDALHRVVEVKKEAFLYTTQRARGGGGAAAGGGRKGEDRYEERLREIMGVLIDEVKFPLGQLEYHYDAALFEDWNGYRALGTPLHCAVKARNEEAVKILLEKGADKDFKDTRGRTAVDLAREDGGVGGMMGLLEG